ncbi:hypothetical protein F5Y00DRAFT_272791 [Daldinia vernicosa]|uniref:uncharacterized protein n=1 Tax=Daldinia vernicosa TaxID=114800 RepID=UPI002008CF89|nr:uncharacterized protein F5Y00DRAFT_272791 [Daldinia vernicosa]KAI0845607.1 hypothetical protein F5Y00DRAFT_272791 [Daldinia vernicosa]
MCQIWSQEYSECHHVSRNLIHCPTYYKQQSEANSFLGRLFNGSVKRKKDCGRVIPHYGELVPFCPACSVKNDQLWGNPVGDGALRVRHPHMRDEYQYHSREHRERSENSAERSCRRSDRHGQEGVWIPGLYYEPENLAQRDPYIRTAGKARPVSPVQLPPRPPSRPEQKRDKSEAHPLSSTKNYDEHEHRHQVSTSNQPSQKAERKGDKPVKSNERRLRVTTKETSSSNISRRSGEPASPAPNRDRERREADDRDRDKSARSRRSSRIPTLIRRPPTPPPKDPVRKWPPPIRHYIDPIPKPQPQPPTSHYVVDPIPKPAPSPIHWVYPIPKPPPAPPPEKHPRLRRKPGQVHYAPPPPPSPSAPALKPPPAPLPEYQVYLNAQRFAKDYHPPASPAIEKSIEPPMFRPPLRPPPQRSKASHPGAGLVSGFHVRPALRRVGPLRFSDSSSDESFVCCDARQLTLNGARASR